MSGLGFGDGNGFFFEEGGKGMDELRDDAWRVGQVLLVVT